MTLRAACTAILVAAAAATLTACSNDEVKGQWEDRTKLPSCGTVTLSAGDGPLEELKGEQVDCLKSAFDSGKPGELEVRSSTDEGDPLVEYYRVTDKGTTEHYTDATKDPNSDKKWSYGDCDHPQNAFDAAC